MALNRGCLGRVYRGEPTLVDARELGAFVEALGEDPARWVDAEGRAVAHPAFPFRLIRGVMPQVLDDPELGLDRVRMVHGEQGFEYVRPIRDGDQVALEAQIVGIEDKPSGQLLRTEQRLLIGSQLVVKGLAVAFIRGESSGRPGGAAAAPVSGGEPELLARSTRSVDLALARRYAEVSGDDNPIHLDEAAARAAGLPGVILHGACTLALAMTELVRLAGLQSVQARFVRPVRLPDELTIAIWSRADQELGFDVKNQSGETVLGSGLARALS